MSIINLKDEVVDLFLEKLNDRVALGDHCITLVDLILLCHQGLKLLNLGDLAISIPKVTFRDTDQLTHTVT
jgi:hypothetical protein